MNIFPLLAGGIPAIIYFLLCHKTGLQIRIIDSLFVGGLFPLLTGCFRWICSIGSFDLFVYSNKRIWGRRQTEEPSEKTVAKQDSYHDYLLKKGPAKPFASYILVGLIYLAAALFFTWIWV